MSSTSETNERVNIRISTPKNLKNTLERSVSAGATTCINGAHLLDLRGRHLVNKKSYEGIAIVIDALTGSEAGLLRVNIRLGSARMVTFILGWKNPVAELFIGDDPFRIELV